MERPGICFKLHVLRDMDFKLSLRQLEHILEKMTQLFFLPDRSKNIIYLVEMD